ncbi:MAG TPA: uridine kinase [Longimicrobiales bacterium]|nr:uridine kinase [Longimicrobiales bacterium]
MVAEPAPVTIGVAGGSGSGKSTVVRRIVEGLAVPRVAVIHHDAYYRDLGDLPFEDRAKINYDHPDSLETELLVSHLKELKAGRPVEVPLYDFAAHERRAETRTVRPASVLIVDGILILALPALRELMDIKVFVDTDADVRLMRRLRRDLEERDRAVESVLRQYALTVRPMHIEFVEPSKRWADLIVPGGGYNDVAVDVLVTKVSAILLAGSETPTD